MTPLLEVDGLVKHFPLRRGTLRAVDGVSFRIELGETLGVVGESGCGKSTLARLILRLIDADAGEVRFRGEDLFAASDTRLKRVRRDLQLVFQDPYASLNPRMTTRDAIAFNLLIHGTARSSARERADAILDDVGDSEAVASAHAYRTLLSDSDRSDLINFLRVQLIDGKVGEGSGGNGK